MEGLFRSTLTGRLYEFVRWAENEDMPVIIAQSVTEKEEYRVPYSNVDPVALGVLRVANETA